MAAGHGGARRGSGPKPKIDRGPTDLVPYDRPRRPNRLPALPDEMKQAMTWRDEFKQLAMEFETPVLRELLEGGTRSEKFQALAYIRGYISGSIPKGENPKEVQKQNDVATVMFSHIIEKKALEEKLALAEARANALEEGEPIDVDTEPAAEVPKP